MKNWQSINSKRSASSATGPYIRRHLDVVGFWVNLDEAPQITGPPLDELGSATVTWVIRWEDMATRNETMSRVFTSDEWSEIMKQNPGEENYLRMEAKFTAL